MSEFLPDLPARDVDRRLREALAVLRRAEQNAVLWFAEVLRRKLYRDLGYGSIQQYAELALGFGPAKTAQFVRLVRALEALPQVRQSLRRGEVTWTQARTVAAVATSETEQAWLATARKTTSRGLEATVRAARVRAREAAASGRQANLGLEAAKDDAKRTGKPSGENLEEPAPVPPVEALPLPRDIHLRVAPEQAARFEALLEAARKQGARGDRAELLLAGLEALVTGGGSDVSDPGDQASCRDSGDRKAPTQASGGRKSAARTAGSPYQVLVQLCPSCAGGSVVAAREPQPLHPRELRAILCDARIRKPGERNRAVIPPRVRRAVLERDGHRCRGAGCRSARFLAVHHLTPRAAGGSNEPENLITLCAACHRTVHVYGRVSDAVGTRVDAANGRRSTEAASDTASSAGPR